MKSIYRYIWWKLVPGTSILLRWPGLDQESSDPSDVYRPWIEENIGKQLIHWDWALCNHDPDLIELKIVSKQGACLAKLKWGNNGK